MNHQLYAASLSKRLKRLAEWVVPEAKVLDVGTDHALLPMHLIQSGRAASVIAADVAKGPYETARRNVLAAGLASKIDVRLGSGLSVVTPGEVDTIVVAGMGGSTIAQILQVAPLVLAEVKHLLLQPMNATGRLRETLQMLSLEIRDELMLEEAGHHYQLIHAAPGTQESVAKQYEPYIQQGQAWLAQEFGPFNLARTTDENVRQVIQETHRHLRSILAGFKDEGSEAAANRREELNQQLHQLEEWLALS